MKIGILKVDSVLPEFRNRHGDYPQMLVQIFQRNSMQDKKKLRFKTFDVAWAEDYDEIINPRQRISRVITILTDLCNKDNTEWHVLNKRLIPILKHNQEVMLNLKEIPTLTWDNIPDFIINNPQKDLYESYLDPAQGIEAIANLYYAGDIKKAKNILDIS